MRISSLGARPLTAPDQPCKIAQVSRSNVREWFHRGAPVLCHPNLSSARGARRRGTRRRVTRAARSGLRDAPSVLVVAPGGSDTAAGTVGRAAGAPIQAAVDRLAARRPGRAARRDLPPAGPARRRSRHHARAVPARAPGPQRAGLTPPTRTSARSWRSPTAPPSTVRGLDLTAYRTAKLDVTPAGIYVHGHDRSIPIVGNHVHDLGNNNRTLGSFDINAHGIAVYGDDPHAPITDLRDHEQRRQPPPPRRQRERRRQRQRRRLDHRAQPHPRQQQHRHRRHRLRGDAHRHIPLHDPQPGAPRTDRGQRRRPGSGPRATRPTGRAAKARTPSGATAPTASTSTAARHIRVTGNRVVDNDIGIEVAAENARGQRGPRTHRPQPHHRQPVHRHRDRRLLQRRRRLRRRAHRRVRSTTRSTYNVAPRQQPPGRRLARAARAVLHIARRVPAQHDHRHQPADTSSTAPSPADVEHGNRSDHNIFRADRRHARRPSRSAGPAARTPASRAYREPPARTGTRSYPPTCTELFVVWPVAGRRCGSMGHGHQRRGPGRRRHLADPRALGQPRHQGGDRARRARRSSAARPRWPTWRPRPERPVRCAASGPRPRRPRARRGAGATSRRRRPGHDHQPAGAP